MRNTESTVPKMVTFCRSKNEHDFARIPLPMIGNARLLVQLRWVAIGFQILALLGAVLLKLPVQINLFLFGLSIQILVNIIAFASLKKTPQLPEFHVFIQLVLDLLSLNIFVLAVGGLANPFSGLFLIQAIIAAMLLTGVRLALMILATGLSYTCLLLVFNPSCESHQVWMAFHIQGMVINHIVTTAVVGYFLAKLVQNLKLKEQQLSAKHSLIGAGATAAQMAHKLGTPLNSMALIAYDLSDSQSQDKAVLIEEINRCKEYLSTLFNRLHRLDTLEESILLKPSFDRFFSKLTKVYPFLTVTWTLKSDRLLRSISVELILLILDIMAENAAEAGAKTLEVAAHFSKKQFHIQIQNNGPPLPQELETLMKAGFSGNKSAYHTGMGLYLARLIMENLGASVEVNQGAHVDLVIRFPLDMLCAL